MPAPDSTWDQLRRLIVSAAERLGRTVDADRILSALSATVTAFTRRRDTRQPIPAALQRRRFRRAATSLTAAEDALVALGRVGRAALCRWADAEALRGLLERVACGAEQMADQPVRRGGRRDEVTRALVLEVAWILCRGGLPLSTYEDGLLAQVARATAARAGRTLPADHNVRRLLRPAVLFCRRQGLMECTSGERSDDLVSPAPDSIPCHSKVMN